jgi:hypothetical protein
MTRILVYVAAAMIISVSLASSAAATTAPTVTVKVQVRVSDNALTMSTYRARRGWGADFVVRNVGRKPHKFEIGELSTRLLRPGAKGVVRSILELRGRYPYKVTVNPGGPKHKGWFIVY